jgi:hypothetical protein
MYLVAIFFGQQNKNRRQPPNARNSRLKRMPEAVLAQVGYIWRRLSSIGTLKIETDLS